ncbi:formylglycine-generating enzyme family protein [Pendulispora albinea]|uniref:Formylglycine-generating enzyme family protein n=1 Tax=Pendulispora albinea TaxID=2741071 RepID=A0ABZ2LM11_9BACT
MKIGAQAAIVVFGAIGAGALGCSLLLDAGSLSEGGGARPPPDDGGIGGDAAGPAIDSGGYDGPCPRTKGPAMVRVGNHAGGDAAISFCVDATEVSVAQYRQFVATNDGGKDKELADCAFNTSYEPMKSDGGPPDRVADNLPVVYVDWCDAFAYCAWAGKRLCGAIGGGPAPIGTPGDARENQWMFACSAGGSRAYPYDGNDGGFVTNVCHDGLVEKSTEPPLLPVTRVSPCEGGFPDLFDMSGNVEEWEDSCDKQRCHTRGGSAFDWGRHSADTAVDIFACAVPFRAAGTPMGERNPDVGFRCCSD